MCSSAITLVGCCSRLAVLPIRIGSDFDLVTPPPPLLNATVAGILNEAHHDWTELTMVLHGEGKIWPATPRNLKTTINPAEDNRKKQCKPNETRPDSNTIHAHTRHSNFTRSQTPSRVNLKSTHTCRTYTGVRPPAPGHQEAGHPVPARTDRHNPPWVWM